MRGVIGGRRAVASDAPFLADCGVITSPAWGGHTDREQLRSVCAEAAVGITSADYALADTGSLVMLSRLPRPA